MLISNSLSLIIQFAQVLQILLYFLLPEDAPEHIEADVEALSCITAAAVRDSATAGSGIPR